MKIAVLAPVEIRVPPVAYGGTELVVSLLTEELVRRGHDVTLYASGDSVTSARLLSVVPEYLRKAKQDARFFSYLNMIKCFENAEDYDMIHNHVMGAGLLGAGLVKTPTLTTLHMQLHDEELLTFKHYKGWYNTISQSAVTSLPKKKNYVGTIYNAVDCFKHPFNAGPRKGYLLYFSRFSPEKGAHIAIRVAKKLGKKLIMAGNLSDKEYFRKQVLPYVDGQMIQWEFEVDGPRKVELLANAECLLAPILWDELFGLFMVEALACGTPVIAFNRGAAPELIKDRETGFIVDTTDQMVEAVKNCETIDPGKCRDHVLRHFHTPVMASRYLEVYRRILSEGINATPEIVVKS